jgi:hypothetical protein
MIDVARSHVSRATNFEIQPSKFEFSVEIRVAFLGDDYSPAFGVANVETKTLDQHIEKIAPGDRL